ncbi:secretion-regulating guanine nucleotide exchange factor [Anaeramoeba ignava]|uniref:Secretion-regulating guanine nucleotide exchange factor n=1 Tax=Anaeramoeba ignava TaxID=1746090 RepID=A0A9Q0LQY9_ANAIG|nr:secretion-regulating guanine nucleotide exchange factor [Anaeramoeba ignava]
MNEILFCGSNKYPKLIKNKPERLSKRTRFKFENENENRSQIKQISSGGYVSTIFLFENGKAIEYSQDSYQNPQKIPIENIQKVSVGYRDKAILTADGIVFAKGKHSDPKEFINISSLIEDKNDRVIEDIICSFSSIYLLTSNQNAYGIGSNRDGQLGFDSEKLRKTQKPILMMKNVSKIFSGNSSYYVFLLNSNQELFVCGYNDSGQVGLGKSTKETKIQKLTQIQNIPKGKIIDIKYEDTYEFTEIKSSLFENDNILDFSCGYDFTSILTSKPKIIAFGGNEHGQFGVRNTTRYQLTPIQIELPKLRFNRNISNYHLSCGYQNSFVYYSPFSPFSNLEEDLIKLFRRKEFCDISFKTKNEEIIEAHKLILKYRLKDQNQIEKLKEIISKKSIKESNQIFEMIYSNKQINPKLYSEIKEIINSNEKIEETIKRIYLNENENENDFIIERKEKQYKFPKLILIMRSELYRGMFLSVTNDTSNKVTDYSELSNKSFQIFEYWIYSNQIKNEIEITQEIIDEIQIGIDYFQLNQTNPNLFDLLIKKFNYQENKKEIQKLKSKILLKQLKKNNPNFLNLLLNQFINQNQN